MFSSFSFCDSSEDSISLSYACLLCIMRILKKKVVFFFVLVEGNSTLYDFSFYVDSKLGRKKIFIHLNWKSCYLSCFMNLLTFGPTMTYFYYYRNICLLRLWDLRFFFILQPQLVFLDSFCVPSNFQTR